MRADLCHLKACRAVLTIETDGKGRIVATCPRCERNRAGFCRGCPTRIQQLGRKLKFWCEACIRLRDNDRHRRSYRADPEHHRTIKRLSDVRLGEAARERRREKQRARVQANPPQYDAFDRVYKRAHYHQRKAADPTFRAKLNAKRRAWLSNPEVRERWNADQRRRRADKKARAA